ncbi:hypothetical protein AB0D49_32835 [Streptomyces sp. NPDC048290]|uniref:hypothetical protein n=1 Tax=Streptomyces sp. NPDC048290 TaxID=3155811 RepID=UPI00342D09F3
MSNHPICKEFEISDIRLLISRAIKIYDTHGDEHQILSQLQIDTIKRLRSLPEVPTDDEIGGISERDVLSILTTAVELIDREGAEDPEEEDAASRVREFLDVDDIGD